MIIDNSIAFLTSKHYIVENGGIIVNHEIGIMWKRLWPTSGTAATLGGLRKQNKTSIIIADLRAKKRTREVHWEICDDTAEQLRLISSESRY
jgi:hypothetical protein